LTRLLTVRRDISLIRRLTARRASSPLNKVEARKPRKLLFLASFGSSKQRERESPRLACRSFRVHRLCTLCAPTTPRKCMRRSTRAYHIACGDDGQRRPKRGGLLALRLQPVRQHRRRALSRICVCAVGCHGGRFGGVVNPCHARSFLAVRGLFAICRANRQK
jgi:hypothetical protein